MTLKTHREPLTDQVDLKVDLGLEELVGTQEKVAALHEFMKKDLGEKHLALPDDHRPGIYSTVEDKPIEWDFSSLSQHP